MSQPRTALITGVSSGIGRATAELFARHGFRTFGTLRRPGLASAPAGVELVPMDVRDDRSVEEGIDQILASTRRIDVLVNNAGITHAGALEETTMEEARAIFETNFFGLVRVTRRVLPIMRAQSGGRIIHVGSLGCFLPMPFQGMYAATKHALDAFSETLDHEVRGFGVRSILIQPGYIRTAISNNAALPQQPVSVYDDQRRRTGKLLDQRIREGDQPERVAETILRAATAPQPRLKYLSGRGAGTLHLAWWLLPAALFGYGLRRHFGLR